MRTVQLFLVFLAFIGLSACKESPDSKSMNMGDATCDDTLSTYITSDVSDSLHSLQIKTYSSLDSFMKKGYPCVTKQELIFKLKDSTIKIEQVPMKDRLFDSSSQCSFLKYIITGIAVDSIKSQKVYMLYLFAANGEAEYNFYYNQRGKILFSQRCDKKGCNIRCYDFDEKTAISYCNDDSRILSIKEVKGICQ
jgi:hypothetical protein